MRFCVGFTGEWIHAVRSMPDLLCVKLRSKELAAASMSSKLYYTIGSSHNNLLRLLRNAIMQRRFSVFNAFRVIQTGVKELFEIRRVRKEAHTQALCLGLQMKVIALFLSHTLQR